MAVPDRAQGVGLTDGVTGSQVERQGSLCVVQHLDVPAQMGVGLTRMIFQLGEQVKGLPLMDSGVVVMVQLGMEESQAVVRVSLSGTVAKAFRCGQRRLLGGDSGVTKPAPPEEGEEDSGELTDFVIQASGCRARDEFNGDGMFGDKPCHRTTEVRQLVRLDPGQRVGQRNRGRPMRRDQPPRGNGGVQVVIQEPLQSGAPLRRSFVDFDLFDGEGAE
jgi:hypothetical protein